MRHRVDVVSTSDLTVAIDAIRFQISLSVNDPSMKDLSDCLYCSVQAEIQTLDGVKLHSTANAFAANQLFSLTIFSQDDAHRALLSSEVAVVTSLIKLGCSGPVALSRNIIDFSKPSSTHPSTLSEAPPSMPGNMPYRMSTRVAEVKGVLTAVNPQPNCTSPQ